MRTDTARKVLRRLGAVMLPVIMLMGLGSASAAANLVITPISWNVIGLDSNNVTVGPNRYPVGARVCNTGPDAATNVKATITLEGGQTNPYISVHGLTTLGVASLPSGSGSASTRYQESVAPSNCADFYFVVDVARNANAYSSRVGDGASPAQRNTQLYYITALADNATSKQTDRPRELYVEKLISQGRNSVTRFTGPTSVYVGGTYEYVLDATTAPGGYEQLEVFANFPNNIFQILKVNTTYSTPSGSSNSTVYADACGWENNPVSTSYHNNLTCIGPANYTGAKAGDVISTKFTVKILSAGTATVQTTINDFSGSSYHYNADFGTAIGSLNISAQAAPQSTDLEIFKTHTTIGVGSTTGTYTITVRNAGATPTNSGSVVTVVDTLPSGLSFYPSTNRIIAGWDCKFAQATMTCTRSDALAGGQAYPDLTFGVSVGQSVKASTVYNTAEVTYTGDSNASNNKVTDPTNITDKMDLSIVKTQLSPTTTPVEPSALVTYTLTIKNASGSADAVNAVLWDPAVSGFTAQSVVCSDDDAKAVCPASADQTITNLQNGLSIPLLKPGGDLIFTVKGIASIPAGSASNTYTNTAYISVPSGYLDSAGGDNVSSVSTTVRNQPPVASTVTNATLLTTAVPTTLSTGLRATDPDGTVVSYTVQSLPASASGVLALNGTAVTVGQVLTPAQAAALTFAPTPGYSGTASFTYSATDNLKAVSNVATYSLPVSPVARDDVNTVNGNVASIITKNSVSSSVLSNDLGTGLAANSVIFPSQSAVTISNAGKTLTNSQGTYSVSATGAISFTPADGFGGATAPVTYQVTDGSNQTASATLTITVNAPPVANNDSATTDLNTPVTFSLTANDTDMAPGTVNVATVDLDPAAGGLQSTLIVSGKGTFNVSPAGDVTFTPVSGFNGQVTAPYVVQDNAGALSNTATITVTVRSGTPDLTVTKTASAAYMTPGTPATASTPAADKIITYTLTVKNLGTASTTGLVSVTDTLPSSLVANSISGTGWNCPTDLASPLTCTRTTPLAAGNSYEPVTVKVRAPYPGELESTASLRTITNSATVSGGGEVNTGNNAGTATTTMVYAKLIKSVRTGSTATSVFGTAGNGKPGQTLQYCIEFRNYGGGTLANFKVADAFPVNTTFVPGSLVYSAPATSLSGTSTPPANQTLPQVASYTASATGVTLDLGSSGLASGGSGVICFSTSVK